MSSFPDPQAYERRSDILHGLLLVLLTVVLLRDYFFTWPTPFIYANSTLGTDLIREIVPLAGYIKQMVAQTGVVPLWRPYVLSGAPLVGHPVAPITYPTYWLVLVLPIPLALNIHVLLHLVLGALGMYAFLRRSSRLSPTAAFAGALIFGHAPRLFAHLGGGHLPMLTALAWMPWAWLAFHQFWWERRMRWAVLLGIALAAMAFNDGRYLFICVYSLGFCTLWFLKRPVRDTLVVAVKLWLVAGVIAIGLAAMSILPTLSLIPYSERNTFVWTDNPAEGIPPAMLLGVLLPTTLKLPEWTFFLGSVAVTLVVMSALAGWQRRHVYWALGAVLALIFTAGPTTPIYGFVFRYLPGGSLFRGSERWWLISLFALAVLAADGLQRWLERPNRVDSRLRFGLLVLGAFYGISLGLGVAFPSLLPFVPLPTALFALAAVIILLMWRRVGMRLGVPILMALLWLDLGAADAQLIRPEASSAVYASDAIMNTLSQHLAADFADERVFAPYGYGYTTDAVMQQAGFKMADGYDSFGLRDYFAYLRVADQCDFREFVVGAPATRISLQAVAQCPTFVPRFDLLAALNIRYVLLQGKVKMPEHTPLSTDGDKRLYMLDAPLGRGFGVAQVTRVMADQCFAQLASIDARQMALVESALPTATLQALRVVSSQRQVNGETFELHADADGLLIRSEVWDPHWQVMVDGQPAQVERVDCALQGVWVTAGEHHVVFAYMPMQFWIGGWISLGTLVVLLIIGLMQLRQR